MNIISGVFQKNGSFRSVHIELRFYKRVSESCPLNLPESSAVTLKCAPGFGIHCQERVQRGWGSSM